MRRTLTRRTGPDPTRHVTDAWPAARASMTSRLRDQASAGLTGPVRLPDPRTVGSTSDDDPTRACEGAPWPTNGPPASRTRRRPRPRRGLRRLPARWWRQELRVRSARTGPAGFGSSGAGCGRTARQPVRGVHEPVRRWRHEPADVAAAERLLDARRRRLAVRAAADGQRLRRQLGGDQGHRPQDRRRRWAPIPSLGFGQQQEITEAASIAEIWLDAATDFPRVSTVVSAWSRAEWIENTMPVWKRLVEPVATHIADAMEGAL